MSLQYFKMSLQYFEEKKYFYQNVFLSLYLNIVCKNVVCDMTGELHKFHLRPSQCKNTT